MVVMDGGPGQGLILHEVGHIYAHGILGNNEWLEAWLDEGMASFLTAWFEEETQGSDPWPETMERLELGLSRDFPQPVSTPAADFLTFNMYSTMSYRKGSIFLYMLREYLGENVFRNGMRYYFAENRFRHVTEMDFRVAMEAVSGQDLAWFFQQWLHTTDGLDYAIVSADARREPGGGWLVRVEVTRTGEVWMPVTLRIGEQDIPLASRERRQVLQFLTATKPDAAELDPQGVLLDSDRSNNRRVFR